jgi:hypothetical protein
MTGSVSCRGAVLVDMLQPEGGGFLGGFGGAG